VRRAFDIDALACPRCGGQMRLLATVENPNADSCDPGRARGVARAGGTGVAVRRVADGRGAAPTA